MLLYFVFVWESARPQRHMKTSKDSSRRGRALPAWICGLAFISANLGAQEVIGMGRRAPNTASKLLISTDRRIPAMIFVGIFMMPFYYGSKCRSVPKFSPPALR